MKKKFADPARVLVPDLVTTWTNAPPLRPNSGAAPSETTTISLMASWLKVNAGRCPPRCSPKNGLLKSAPSTETLFAMPFWPLTLIMSPSGPCTIVTPGVSCMNERKFRPLFGNPATACSLMRVVCSDRVVSTTGESAVTVTSCCTVESCMVTGMFAVWPTVNVMPSRT